MEINADTLLKQIVTMIAIKLVTFYAIKQTNFSFFIEILVTGVRVLMVHMIDQIDEKFWISEATYAIANFTIKNYLLIGKYLEVMEKDINSDACLTDYFSTLLSMNLFGIITLMLLSSKNHKIKDLEFQIKIKDDLVSQLIKSNTHNPMTLLKINNQSLIQIKEFQKLFTKTEIPFFDSIEMELEKQMEISSNSTLYQVIKCNSKAKFLFKSTDHDLIPMSNHNQLESQVSRDVTTKLRQIKPLQGLPQHRSLQKKSQKNLHNILNYSSAMIFQDLIHKKIKGKEHDKNMDNKINSIESITDNLMEDGEESQGISNHVSQNGRSSIIMDQLYDSKEMTVKKMSEFGLQLFNQEFADSGSSQKWHIQCLIVHDMFLINFIEQKSKKVEIVKDKLDQLDVANQEIVTVDEQRPFQSVYQIQAQVDDSLKIKNPHTGSKHIIQRNVSKQEQSPPRSILRDSKKIRSQLLPETRRYSKITAQQQKLEESSKNADFLRFEEGSLRSKDMLIESQTSTIKININQSEVSHRSFYSEVNQSKKLDSDERNMMEASQKLKNQQKEMALEFFKSKVIQLSDELVNTRIFLNMVIHDMRNPINNISFALDATLKNIIMVSLMVGDQEKEVAYQMASNIKSQQRAQSGDFEPNDQNITKKKHIRGSPIIPREELKVDKIRHEISNQKLRPKDCNSVVIQKRPSLDFQMKDVLESHRRQDSMRVHNKDDLNSENMMAQSEQIKSQLSKMSQDIDSKKNLFMLEMEQLAELQNDESYGNESAFRQGSIQQSFGSIVRGPQEDKDINEGIKTANPKEMTFKQMDSPKQSEQEPKMLQKRIKKSKFFNQDNELEEEESNSVQVNLKNKIVEKSQNLNLNQLSEEVSFEGYELKPSTDKISDDNSNDQIKQSKNQQSKEEVGIPAKIENMHKAMVAGRQAIKIPNQSSYSSMKISSNMHSRSGISSIDEFMKSNDIADERSSSFGDMQKIRCPSFKLQGNYDSSKNLHFNTHGQKPALDQIQENFSEANQNVLVSKSLDQIIQMEEIIDNKDQEGSLNDRIDNQYAKDEDKKASSDKVSTLKQKLHRIHKIKDNLAQTLELIEGCDYSSNLSANLINDLLDFAKMQQLSFTITKGWFDIVKTVQNAYHVLRFEQKRKNIEFKLSVSKSDSKTLSHIYNDESRFMQILLNFLSNSLKFTPNNGCVEIKMSCQERIQMSDSFAFEMDMADDIQKCSSANVNRYISMMSQNSIMVSKSLTKKTKNDPVLEITKKFQNNYDYMKIIIEITDNGVGISPEKIKSVFMNFNSLAEHQKMNPRGTGLGLSICKNLIEKMGGQVNVSSLQGKGTTFSVEMMALCRHGSDKRKDFNKKDQEQYQNLMKSDISIEEPDLRKRKVPNFNPFKSIKRSQIDELIQESLEKSLDKDFGCQDNSWKKQIKRIKSMGKGDFNLFSGSNEDISISESQNISCNNESGIQQNLEGGGNDFKSELRALRFLIANDDYFQILAIESILNEFDIYDVVKADNGLVAYEKSLSQKFDFIIMDINMPVMDGVEAGKKILEHYNQKSFMSHSHIADHLSINHLTNIIPSSSCSSSSKAPQIYGLSAFVSQEQIKQVKDLGFVDCLTAPFTSNLAYKILKSYIDRQLMDYKDIQQNQMSQNDQYEEQKHSGESFADLIQKQSKKQSRKMGAVLQFESNAVGKEMNSQVNQESDMIEEEKESYNIQLSEQLSQMSSLSSNYGRPSLSNSDKSCMSASSRQGPRASPSHQVNSPSQRLQKSPKKRQKKYMQNMNEESIIKEELDDASSNEQD